MKGSRGEYEGRLFIHAKHPDKIQSQWVRERTLGKKVERLNLFV